MVEREQAYRAAAFVRAMGYEVGVLEWATFMRSAKIMALLIRTLPKADPRRVAFDRMVAAAKVINSGRIMPKRKTAAWQNFVDNFGLFRAAYDFLNGHVEAADYAILWYKRRHLARQDWALDAMAEIRVGELRQNRRGRRPPTRENRQFQIDVNFYKEVERSGARLKEQKKKGALPLDTEESPSDRYAHAARKFHDPHVTERRVRRVHDKLKHDLRKRPPRLSALLQHQAPTLYRIVSDLDRAR